MLLTEIREPQDKSLPWTISPEARIAVAILGLGLIAQLGIGDFTNASFATRCLLAGAAAAFPVYLLCLRGPEQHFTLGLAAGSWLCASGCVVGSVLVSSDARPYLSTLVDTTLNRGPSICTIGFIWLWIPTILSPLVLLALLGRSEKAGSLPVKLASIVIALLSTSLTVLLAFLLDGGREDTVFSVAFSPIAFQSVSTGMSRSDVIERLGPPLNPRQIGLEWLDSEREYYVGCWSAGWIASIEYGVDHRVKSKYFYDHD